MIDKDNKKKLKKTKKQMIDKDEFLKKLIKSDRNAILENRHASDNYKVDNEKPLMTKDNLLVVGKDKYHLTPKGILWAALELHYKIDGNMQRFGDFMKDLLQHLSMLASNNEMTDMFGYDFNDFFEVIVKTMNLAGKLKVVLEENGIEFDVKEYLNSELSNDTSFSDDEKDDDLNDNKNKKGPKKKK